jgi:hypothetical protein
MAETLSVIRTVEDTMEGTLVTPIFSGGRPKHTKSEVESIASELANTFRLENSHKRVEFDAIETKSDGTSVIFKHIELDTEETYGKRNKNAIEKMIDDINKKNTE